MWEMRQGRGLCVRGIAGEPGPGMGRNARTPETRLLRASGVRRRCWDRVAKNVVDADQDTAGSRTVTKNFLALDRPPHIHKFTRDPLTGCVPFGGTYKKRGPEGPLFVGSNGRARTGYRRRPRWCGAGRRNRGCPCQLRRTLSRRWRLAPKATRWRWAKSPEPTCSLCSSQSAAGD